MTRSWILLLCFLFPAVAAGNTNVFLHIVSQPDGTKILTWNTDADAMAYELEQTENLLQPTWRPVGVVRYGDGNEKTFVHQAEDDCQFFRVRTEPLLGWYSIGHVAGSEMNLFDSYECPDSSHLTPTSGTEWVWLNPDYWVSTGGTAQICFSFPSELLFLNKAIKITVLGYDDGLGWAGSTGGGSVRVYNWMSFSYEAIGIVGQDCGLHESYLTTYVNDYILNTGDECFVDMSIYADESDSTHIMYVQVSLYLEP
ncbi:MAG: hypothetical protein EOM20_00335 [Spartobacteria bacterium]|nr:hypothetical protein [Spartobacteria bacterium]